MTRQRFYKNIRILGFIAMGVSPSLLCLIGFCFYPPLFHSGFMPVLILFDVIIFLVSYVLVKKEEGLNRQQKDVESRDDPPEYDEVIAKVPPYEWVIQQDMARHSEVITMPVPISEGIPSVHQSLEAWDDNGVPATDPDLPTYLEAITPSSETKT